MNKIKPKEALWKVKKEKVPTAKVEMIIEMGDLVKVILGNGPRSFFTIGKVFTVGRIKRYDKVKALFPRETVHTLGYNIDIKKVERVG